MREETHPTGLTWAEIDLGKLRRNVEIIRSRCAASAKVMAVVKADGYGHGASRIARYLEKCGVDAFAVANASEGIQLRKHGITLPVLILGMLSDDQFPDVVHYRLTPTICTLQMAKQLAKESMAVKRRLPIHIRVDIGLGSVGVAPEECVSLVEQVVHLPYLEVEGLYTHLASAYRAEDAEVQRDLQKFEAILRQLESKNLRIPLIHAASSPAILRYPQAHYRMIRAGILLYGLRALEEPSALPFEPLMSLKSRIVNIRQLRAGESLGYGHYVPRDMRVATAAFGYGDSMFCYFLQGGEVLVQGRRAPILGRPMMDHLMLDVSHLSLVSLGDEVVIFGAQGDAVLTAEEQACRAGIGRVNSECVSMLSGRVPRIYVNGDDMTRRREKQHESYSG